MQMKKLLFFLILCSFLLPPSAYGADLPVLKNGWYRVYIEDVGSIDLPPTMEVLSKVPQFIAVQQGLNKSGDTVVYTGIAIVTDIGSYGDYQKLNFNIHEYNKSEIEELNTLYKQYIQSELTKPGMGQIKIIEWHPLKLETINGMSCIHVSTKQRFNDGLLGFVHVYFFGNNDRMHRLFFSIFPGSDYWKADFADILNSFSITNVR